MPLILLILFIGVPMGELALLLWIADKTHWTYSLGIVVITGVVGVVLLRLHGIFTMRRMKQSLSAGELPTDPLIDTAFLLFAGGLLLTPGVITDLFGLSLIFPPTRVLWRHALKSKVRGQFQMFSWGPMGGAEGPPPGGQSAEVFGQSPDNDDPNVIEGEVVEREDPPE